MQEIHVGVRTLIEFVMRSGDIDSSYRSARRMREGQLVHQRIQKAYGPGFESEVSFQNRTTLHDVTFVVDGRADGVYVDPETILVDEIKSTVRPLRSLSEEEHPLHWAQAQCYAYFLCLREEREEAVVRLTYVNGDEDDPVRQFEKTISKEALEDFYRALLSKYLDFSGRILAWKRKRDASLKEAVFPYDAFRKGQRRMAVGVYEAIERGQNLFIEAPTGIGKTMSVLFPAVKSLERLRTDQIYYLTAKTATQEEAAKALRVLRGHGVALKSVQLQARDKICLNDRVACNPNDCPYAKGHFDRVNDAIFEIYDAEEMLTPETTRHYAEEHRVCPFELELDLSTFSDVVLCDYNYFFDPRAFLRRAFAEEAPSTIILVDEAHNLIDRSREMYSASLSTEEISRVAKIFPQKRDPKIHRALKRALKAIRDFHASLGERPQSATLEHPSTLYDAARQIRVALDDFLAKEADDPDYEVVRQFSFALSDYIKIYEMWMDGFVMLVSAEGEAVTWRIQCIDPSALMQDTLQKVQSGIFFSATLTPMHYYTKLLGGGAHPLVMHLPSPFDPTHLHISQVSLSTRYQARARTLPRLARLLHTWVERRLGNVMVFFPSFSYLARVVEAMEPLVTHQVLVQTRELDGEARRSILERFQRERDLCGFFVLGGQFAEGIDLPGEALSAAAIVSVGLPGLSFTREIIRRYFDRTAHAGFAFSYTYPGMNRVLQAAGRVIRTEEDRGEVLLIDDRFATSPYRALFPAYWTKVRYYSSVEDFLYENGDEIDDEAPLE
ncbi:MAG: helicase C-terminal domain-containing protein [Peptoniphilaceae bacterium]|nr:helicase C-terminal domain-containing protein [Peptoniphilaceae bacterium]MDY6085472.1 helicase C-terminal domain-containing protein [Peptoniphilaceae bacterium]